MQFQDIRSFLSFLEERGELVRVREEELWSRLGIPLPGAPR